MIAVRSRKHGAAPPKGRPKLVAGKQKLADVPPRARLKLVAVKPKLEDAPPRARPKPVAGKPKPVAGSPRVRRIAADLTTQPAHPPVRRSKRAWSPRRPQLGSKPTSMPCGRQGGSRTERHGAKLSRRRQECSATAERFGTDR
jgi:hypothetical protein